MLAKRHLPCQHSCSMQFSNLCQLLLGRHNIVSQIQAVLGRLLDHSAEPTKPLGAKAMGTARVETDVYA